MADDRPPSESESASQLSPAPTSLLVNGDFEAGTTGWGTGGDATLTNRTFFTAPWEPSSGSQMARAQATGSSGRMWIWSQTVKIAGSVEIRGQIKVRTNMKNVRVEVHQRDAQQREVSFVSTPAFTPPWRWEQINYKTDIGGGAVDTFLVVIADASSEATQYLDVDGAELFAYSTAPTSLLANGGFETGTTGWGTGGDGSLTNRTFFTAPWEPQSGSQMARAQASGSSGRVWIWSQTVNIAGSIDIRGRISVRTNMWNVRVEIHQIDSQRRELSVVSTPAFTPSWRWNQINYKTDIVPGAVSTYLSIVADASSEATQYLDVDGATLFANRASFGVHSDLAYGPAPGNTRAQHARRLAQLGVRVARLTAPWALIERSKGVYNWAAMDESINAFVQSGITPVIVLNTSPQWANGSNDFQYVPPGSSNAFWDWRWNYGEFVRTLVNRYKTQVKLWEVGNEVNIDDFWRPAPDVWQYCTWADLMFTRIKEADPGATVALGGLTVLNQAYNPPRQISGVDFLRAMQTWNGGALVPRMGIISIHPYTLDYADDPGAAPGVSGKNRFRDVESVHAVVPGARLWLTEFGWQVGLRVGSATMTADMQARYLESSVETIRGWSYVDMALVFWDWDRNQDLTGYGLIDSAGNVRPAGSSYVDSVGR